QFNGLSAGVNLQNVGTSPEPNTTLPTDLRIGLGYDWDSPFTGLDHQDKWIFDSDLVMPVVPVDAQWQLNLGTEYTHYFGSEYGVLRAGYEFPQTVLGAYSSYSVGGSVGTRFNGMDLSLDYSWTPYGELGSQQRFALTGTFGQKLRGPQPGLLGNYLYPPKNVAVVAGDHSARVTWDPQSGNPDGYDIYMAYSPEAKQWTRLNTSPITATVMTVKNLYKGYKVYFCVSTLKHKSGRVYRESDKSAAVMVIPN
ncbi:MAG TPA: fibronectin type III domain-containing protein, partial [bacterium]|nr:fibronectin type III domain-containing protein [bacterium]